MSTNLEYRGRESRRQASEAHREKGLQRSRARDMVFGETKRNETIGIDETKGNETKQVL